MDTRDDLRIKHASHLFEIKSGLFLKESNIGDFKRAIDDCEKRGHEIFIWMEKTFELGYAKFCVKRYDTVDPSFDEHVLEFERKKKEAENNYGKSRRR